jgi:tetratricopeptide (TPR) repeat protein
MEGAKRMNEEHEVLQSKIAARSSLFWLPFAMMACSWLGAPSFLYAQLSATISDDQVCSDAYNSGTDTNPDGAIAKITSVIQRNTRSWLCFHLRGGLYVQKGDLNQAMLDANRAVGLAPSRQVTPYQLLSVLHVQAGRWAQVLADCDIVLAREHNNIGCLTCRASALYNLGRYSEAIAASNEALKPQNKLPEHFRADAYALRGNAMFRLNRYAEAIDSFDRALALGITDLALGISDEGAHFLRGVAELKLGQLDRARSDAAMVLQLEPRLQIRFSGDHVLELFDLDKRRVATMNAVQAAQAADAKGDWPASFEAWNTACSYGSSYMQDGPAIVARVQDGLFRSYPKLAVRPALPEVAREYMVQAETYFQQKDFARAIEAYGRLIGVAPWFAQAYFNRGLLEGEQQQQYRAAVADMQTYLKLAPNAEDARAAQDQIYAWQAKAK